MTVTAADIDPTDRVFHEAMTVIVESAESGPEIARLATEAFQSARQRWERQDGARQDEILRLTRADQLNTSLMRHLQNAAGGQLRQAARQAAVIDMHLGREHAVRDLIEPVRIISPQLADRLVDALSLDIEHEPTTRVRNSVIGFAPDNRWNVGHFRDTTGLQRVIPFIGWSLLAMTSGAQLVQATFMMGGMAVPAGALAERGLTLESLG